MTVLVVSNDSLNVAMESGPISKPIQPSGIPDAGTICNKVYFNQLSQKSYKYQLVNSEYLFHPTELSQFTVNDSIAT